MFPMRTAIQHELNDTVRDSRVQYLSVASTIDAVMTSVVAVGCPNAFLVIRLFKLSGKELHITYTQLDHLCTYQFTFRTEKCM